MKNLLFISFVCLAATNASSAQAQGQHRHTSNVFSCDCFAGKYKFHTGYSFYGTVPDEDFGDKVKTMAHILTDANHACRTFLLRGTGLNPDEPGREVKADNCKVKY